MQNLPITPSILRLICDTLIDLIEQAQGHVENPRDEDDEIAEFNINRFDKASEMLIKRLSTAQHLFEIQRISRVIDDLQDEIVWPVDGTAYLIHRWATQLKGV